MTTLNHLQEKAIRAHNWTSFSPERRGEQMIKEYNEELAEDLAELRKDTNVSEESITDYATRYERLFSSYLHAKSNTFSAMITGPAKFNTRKHEKANRSEERHYEIFREWRVRAKKAIVRKSQPEKTFISEIDRYKSELEAMKINHEKMKEANKRIKTAIKTGEDLTEFLIKEMGVAPHMIDWSMKFGFGLQNNNANMKRVEERIKEMEQKEAKRGENPITKYTFDGGILELNYNIDRIQIFFTTRPTPAELVEWKQKGLNSFNWSPSANAWQRKITANAWGAVRRMLPNLQKEIN